MQKEEIPSDPSSINLSSRTLCVNIVDIDGEVEVVIRDGVLAIIEIES